jgi:hypothetical protein
VQFPLRQRNQSRDTTATLYPFFCLRKMQISAGNFIPRCRSHCLIPVLITGHGPAETKINLIGLAGLLYIYYIKKSL